MLKKIVAAKMIKPKITATIIGLNPLAINITTKIISRALAAKAKKFAKPCLPPTINIITTNTKASARIAFILSPS